MSKFRHSINKKFCIVRQGDKLHLGKVTKDTIFILAPGGIIGQLSAVEDMDKYWNIVETNVVRSSEVLEVGDFFDGDFVLDVSEVDIEGMFTYVVGH